MMTEFVAYFFIALVFSLIGFFIAKLILRFKLEKEKTSLEKENSTLKERVVLIQQSKDIVENNFIEHQKEFKGLLQEKENLIVKNANLN